MPGRHRSVQREWAVHVQCRRHGRQRIRPLYSVSRRCAFFTSHHDRARSRAVTISSEAIARSCHTNVGWAGLWHQALSAQAQAPPRVLRVPLARSAAPLAAHGAFQIIVQASGLVGSRRCWQHRVSHACACGARGLSRFVALSFSDSPLLHICGPQVLRMLP